MALLRKLNLSIFNRSTTIFRQKVTSTQNEDKPEDNAMDVAKLSSDLPVKMNNPFAESKPKCLLCQLEIEPDFKNVRFLSQFISRHTGKIYDRHVTGLCKEKQKLLVSAIKKAQAAGLMATVMKDPNYLNDPVLFDPWRTIVKYQN